MAKLFIPGPTSVSDEILKAQSKAMIGHRGQECADLMARIQPNRESRVYYRILW